MTLLATLPSIQTLLIFPTFQADYHPVSLSHIIRDGNDWCCHPVSCTVWSRNLLLSVSHITAAAWKASNAKQDDVTVSEVEAVKLKASLKIVFAEFLSDNRHMYAAVVYRSSENV